MSEILLDTDKLEALSGKVVTDITGLLGSYYRTLVINPAYIGHLRLMGRALHRNWQTPLVLTSVTYKSFFPLMPDRVI